MEETVTVGTMNITRTTRFYSCEHQNMIDVPCPICHPAYAQPAEVALSIIQQRFAELVTRLMNGETLSRGKILRYAAYIGPKFHTPEIAAVMQRRKKHGS